MDILPFEEVWRCFVSLSPRRKRQTLRAPFQSRADGITRPTGPLDLSLIILYPLPMAICICQVVEASAGIALRSDQRTNVRSPRRVLTCISNPRVLQ